MFINIFKFEIRYWLTNPAYYFYLVFFFLLGTGAMAGAAGLLGEGSSSVRIANSPMSLFSFVMFFGKLMLFLLPVIAGASVYRDHKSGAYSLLYSYPFTKSEYLSAKFLSSFLAINIIAVVFLLSLLLAAMLPGIPAGRTLPPDIAVYSRLYFVFLLPDLLLFSTLVFAVVALSKNIYAGFVTIVVLFLIRESVARLAGSAEAGYFSLLVEPFGEAAVNYFTRNNTISQNETLSLPFNNIILLNRVLWLGVTASLMTMLYRLFSFEGSVFKRNPKKIYSTSKQAISAGRIVKLQLPKINTEFGIWGNVKTAWYLSNADLKYIVKSGPFISIVLTGIIFISVILMQANPQTGTKILPVTWSILGLPVFFFSMLIIVVTFLYAGVLINRSKTYRVDSFIDSSPMPDYVLLFSKFIALVKMQAVLLLVVMVSGIGFQVYSGYYRFEFGQYVFALFVLHLSGFIIWAFAALFMQTLFKNSYIGLFLLILAAIGISNLPYVGIEKMIFRFNQNPEPDFLLKLSDLSGYGHSLIPFFVYKTYWLIFSIIIFLTALLFWRRELTETFTQRLKSAIGRFKGKLAYSFVILLCGFTASGYFISLEASRSENVFWNSGNVELMIQQFRNKYSHLKNINQPRITSVTVKLELYPESNSFVAEGNYTLINRSGLPVDTLLVRTSFDEITDVSFPDEAEIIINDTLFNFSVYGLSKSIAPGDSIKMNFAIKSRPNTLLVKNSNVLNNGTYIKSDIFPRLGYIFENSSTMNHYQSSDADLVDLEIVAGTAAGQTVVAPGRVEKQWDENDRSYTRFITDDKIKFVFGLHSGEYDVFRDSHNGTGLEVYYHRTHDDNLLKIVDGLKQALDYNILHFGPYRHADIRVVEFPRSEGSYATTAANTISISEIRFLNDSKIINEGLIDISFYVAAHELSHQWWGNGVMPANVPGALMLTESIAEYITAKVYEKRYGKKGAERFLKIQLGRYLNGRTTETGTEPPLFQVDPERSYVSYGKGAVAFYTLSEYIGEEKLNRALKAFYERYKYSGPPYPVPEDLLRFLDAETPDSLKYLITDLFRTVSFYDNRVIDSHISSLGNGNYRIEASFLITKYLVNSGGNKIFTDSSGNILKYISQSGEVFHSLPLRDYIELGYKDKNGEIIFLEKYKTSDIYNSISITVNSEPVEFIVDPFNRLIETEKDDNR